MYTLCNVTLCMGLLTGYHGRPCCSKVLLLWFDLFPSSCTLYIYQRFYSAHNLMGYKLHVPSILLERSSWMFIFPVFTFFSVHHTG